MPDHHESIEHRIEQMKLLRGKSDPFVKMLEKERDHLQAAVKPSWLEQRAILPEYRQDD